jgi:hypothetical protein
MTQAAAADRGGIGCEAFRVVRGCHGHFNALAGKRLAESVPILPKPIIA